MNHAEFIVQQIIDLSPDGENTTSRDPESGSDRIWYRVRVPVLRDFIKRWKAENHSSISYDDWEGILDQLYHGGSIDEREAAGMILTLFPDYRRILPLTKLDAWIGQLIGWKEIDNTCQSAFTADDLLSDFDAWKGFLLQLSADPNISKRRASLVLLVKSIRSEHQCFMHLALELIDSLKHEKDKLITKAISWLLRSAVSQHHSEISDYIEANAESLPAIAVRETTKKLQTGRK